MNHSRTTNNVASIVDNLTETVIAQELELQEIPEDSLYLSPDEQQAILCILLQIHEFYFSLHTTKLGG